MSPKLHTFDLMCDGMHSMLLHNTMQKLQFAEVQVLAPKCGGTPDAAAHGFAVMHNNMLIDDWDRKKMDTMHL